MDLAGTVITPVITNTKGVLAARPAATFESAHFLKIKSVNTKLSVRIFTLI